MPLWISLNCVPIMGKDGYANLLQNKLAEELKLVKIDIKSLLTVMEKIINPPPVDEAELKKKPAGGKPK